MTTEGDHRVPNPDTTNFPRPFSIRDHDEAIISEAARHAKMAALEITSTFDNTAASSGCASSSIATAGHQSDKRPASSTMSGGVAEATTRPTQETPSAALENTLQPLTHYDGRKPANPTPLGLSAFALTTFVLSCVKVNARGVNVPNIAVPLALGYGGLVQLLAGMWEMAAGNTFGATALSSYGGFWVAYGVLLTPGFGVLGPGGAYDSAENPGMAGSAVGIFLSGWFVFSVVLTLLTLRSNLALFSMFFTLDLTFLLLAVAEFAGSDGGVGMALSLTRAGGVMGLVTAFLAWYNAFAGMADDSNFFCTIPVYHFPWSKEAMGIRSRKKTEREMV